VDAAIVSGVLPRASGPEGDRARCRQRVQQETLGHRGRKGDALYGASAAAVARRGRHPAVMTRGTSYDAQAVTRKPLSSGSVTVRDAAQAWTELLPRPAPLTSRSPCASDWPLTARAVGESVAQEQQGESDQAGAGEAGSGHLSRAHVTDAGAAAEDEDEEFVGS